MSVNGIATVQAPDLAQQLHYAENVIDARAIKTILYLGLKGSASRHLVEGLGGEETHTVDTFV